MCVCLFYASVLLNLFDSHARQNVIKPIKRAAAVCSAHTRGQVFFLERRQKKKFVCFFKRDQRWKPRQWCCRIKFLHWFGQCMRNFAKVCQQGCLARAWVKYILDLLKIISALFYPSRLLVIMKPFYITICSTFQCFILNMFRSNKELKVLLDRLKEQVKVSNPIRVQLWV